jgi:hypothetical protein
MAINQNHLTEELNGQKCAIVEKNAPQARVDFLRPLLEYNGFTVVVAPSPPPKTAPAETPTDPAPETFTVGVTDVTFNPINAIFGRLLKTPDKHTVTLAYWRQQETESDDEKPYFEGRP